MFQEKYLIFREAPPTGPNKALESANRPNTKAERAVISSDIADDLTKTESKETLANETIQRLQSFTEKNSKWLQSILKIPSAVTLVISSMSQNDKLNYHVKDMMNKGYTLTTIADGGVTLAWNKEGQNLKELNPAFLDPNIYNNLNSNGKKLVLRKQAEIEDQATDKLMEGYANYLKKMNFIDQKLNFKQFKNSDFGKILFPILSDINKKGIPYVFEASANGFTLKPSRDGLAFYTFDLRDFDRNLNSLSKLEKLVDAYIKLYVLPHLQREKPNLSEQDILSSYLMTQEVRPLLVASYRGPASYRFQPTAEGFLLHSQDKNNFDRKFDFKDYDEKLNLLTDAQPSKQTKSDEKDQTPQGKVEKIIDEKYREQKDLLATANLSMEQIHDQLEKVVAKNPATAIFNREAVKAVSELEAAPKDQRSKLLQQMRSSGRFSEIEKIANELHRGNNYEDIASVEIYEGLFEAASKALGIDHSHSEEHEPHEASRDSDVN